MLCATKSDASRAASGSRDQHHPSGPFDFHPIFPEAAPAHHPSSSPPNVSNVASVAALSSHTILLRCSKGCTRGAATRGPRTPFLHLSFSSTFHSTISIASHLVHHGGPSAGAAARARHRVVDHGDTSHHAMLDRRSAGDELGSGALACRAEQRCAQANRRANSNASSSQPCSSTFPIKRPSSMGR